MINEVSYHIGRSFMISKVYKCFAALYNLMLSIIQNFVIINIAKAM